VPKAARLNGAKGGRPKGSKTLISAAMVKHLCLRNFRKHVRYLEDIAANSDSHQARISAIVVLMERGLGKVPKLILAKAVALS
jgi:hypothetical protein